MFTLGVYRGSLPGAVVREDPHAGTSFWSSFVFLPAQVCSEVVVARLSERTTHEDR
jgi:hypothetical protein